MPETLSNTIESVNKHNNNNRRRGLFGRAFLNHILWSSQPVASRYLQVLAQPQVFDGQGVLCTAKAASAILLFLFSHSVCCPANDNDNKTEDTNTDVLTTSDELKDDNKTQEECCDGDGEAESSSLSSSRLRTKVFFAMIFGTTATFRAALSIASSKFTLSYYTTAINSLTPIVVAFGDAFFLKSALPRALWPCVIASFVGCVVIGISQSPIIANSSTLSISFTSDDAIGCALQFLSMCFSAAARLLMKRTEHILTRNEAVQTNNACNFVFPLLYTLSTNPRGWEAFRHIFVLQNLLAWSTIAIIVYTIGSTGQMTLVRSMGPARYSSLSAVRVLGSALLSTVCLNEPVRNWLEWLGLGIIMLTMTLYTIASVNSTEATNKGTRHRRESSGSDHEAAANSLSGPNENEETIELVTRSGAAL